MGVTVLPFCSHFFFYPPYHSSSTALTCLNQSDYVRHTPTARVISQRHKLENLRCGVWGRYGGAVEVGEWCVSIFVMYGSVICIWGPPWKREAASQGAVLNKLNWSARLFFTCPHCCLSVPVSVKRYRILPLAIVAYPSAPLFLTAALQVCAMIDYPRVMWSWPATEERLVSVCII